MMFQSSFWGVLRLFKSMLQKKPGKSNQSKLETSHGLENSASSFLQVRLQPSLFIDFAQTQRTEHSQT